MRSDSSGIGSVSPVTDAAATSFDAANLDLDALNEAFEAHGDATKMIQWLVDSIPLDRLIVASAMTSDTVLVDVSVKVAPGIDVLFLDTGYHFPETLQTVDAVGAKYPIELVVTPAPPIGDERYLSDPDGCCHQRDQCRQLCNCCSNKRNKRSKLCDSGCGVCCRGGNI